MLSTKNGCRPTPSVSKPWTASPFTFASGPWKAPPSTPFRPTTRAMKWIGICNPKETTARRWSPIPSAATRWRSAFWRVEFQSGAMRMILTFRKCWPRLPISGRNSRCGPEVRGYARDSPAAEQVNLRPAHRKAVSSLVSGMCGALDTLGDAQNGQRQLKQNSYEQNAHKESHDSGDEIDQSLRGRLLITKNDASHDRDSAEDDGDDIQ